MLNPMKMDEGQTLQQLMGDQIMLVHCFEPRPKPLCTPFGLDDKHCLTSMVVQNGNDSLRYRVVGGVITQRWRCEDLQKSAISSNSSARPEHTLHDPGVSIPN